MCSAFLVTIVTNLYPFFIGYPSPLPPSLSPPLPPCTGYDRLLAVLCQSSSLRDVITFPKSFYSKDLFTGAPSELSPWQLSEYNLHQIDSNND